MHSLLLCLSDALSLFHLSLCFNLEGGKKGGREGGKEEGMEGWREGRRKGDGEEWRTDERKVM